MGGKGGEQEEEEEMAVMEAPYLLLVSPWIVHSLGTQIHLLGPRDHLTLLPHLVCAGKEIKLWFPIQMTQGIGMA